MIPLHLAVPLLIATYALEPRVLYADPRAPLSCTIRTAPTWKVREFLRLSVELTNWSGREITLVGALDGSDSKRFPRIRFEIVGPDGNFVTQHVGGCGNTTSLKESDFVRVPAGRTLRLTHPYPKPTDPPTYLLTSFVPLVEGEYRVRFVYSTDNADIRRWLGDGLANNRLERLLAEVPNLTVSSNELTIRVVP